MAPDETHEVFVEIDENLTINKNAYTTILSS